MYEIISKFEIFGDFIHMEKLVEMIQFRYSAWWRKVPMRWPMAVQPF